MTRLLHPLASALRQCVGTLLALVFLATFAHAQAEIEFFEVDALNPGLPAAPEGIDRATPMSAMDSFFDLAEAGRFEDAAQVLDLTNLPPEEQSAKAAQLARQLFVLMDRKVVVPWRSLSDRPDGWLIGSTESDNTGRVRRSIVIDWLELGRHDVALRLNRVKAPDEPPVWVFSRETVSRVPALYELYGPTSLEQALPKWARGDAFWGMYVWEVIFVPLMLWVAAALGWLTYRSVTIFGRKMNTALSHAIVRALRWPATIAVTTAVVGVATTRVLVVSGVLDSLISPMTIIGFVTAATLAVVFVIDEIFDRISFNTPDELADPSNAHMRSMATMISAARKGVIVIALLVASGIVLSSANAFQSIGLSLLASAGALTIILGFAAREVLGNILASVQIALNRSARIGDMVIFEGRYCTVERINFTYVQLLIWTGNRYIVPVSYFVKDAFENWSIEDTKMTRVIELTLAHGADIEGLRNVFLDIVEQEDGDDTGPVEMAAVRVNDQNVFGQHVWFELPTPNPTTAWAMQCKIREQLIRAARQIEQETGQRMLPSDAPRELPAPETSDFTQQF